MSTRIAKTIRKEARKHISIYFAQIAKWPLRERIKLAWRIIKAK